MMKLALCVVVLVALGDAAVYHPKESWADQGQHDREINHHEHKELKEPHQEHDFKVNVEEKPHEPTRGAKTDYHRIDAIREALERDDKHVREARSKHSHYGHNRHSSESSDSSDSSDSSQSHEHNNYGQGRYYKQGFQKQGHQQGYGWQGGYQGYHR